MTEQSYMINLDEKKSELNDQQLLIIFLQLIQSRQKRYINQRKKHTLITTGVHHNHNAQRVI